MRKRKGREKRLGREAFLAATVCPPHHTRQAHITFCIAKSIPNYHCLHLDSQGKGTKMGPPLVDASSSRSREAAIETLIDMDPNGTAYRIARAKVGAGGVVSTSRFIDDVCVCACQGEKSYCMSQSSL
jgi:hypothetical protein